MKDDHDKEARYECDNWDEGAEVRVKPNGDGRLPSRKVVTTGVFEIKLTKAQMTALTTHARQGQEVRFTYDGESVWRVFPVLELSGKLAASVQSMNPFRQTLYKDKTVRLTTQRGTRKVERDVYEKRIEKARSFRRENISPDTLVTCPNCGTEFRVGKKLV